MNLNIFFIFIYLLDFCNSLDFPFIDDIPIENYNHADHREDEIDLELLPIREGRSSVYDDNDDDPKEYFFRNMRTFANLFDSTNKDFGPYQNIPRPSLQQNLFGRKKRSSTNSAENYHHKSLSSIEENLGESSLEIIPLDTTIRNLTEKEDKAETRAITITANQEEINNSNISINDFIRFRRASGKESEQEAIIKPLASEKPLIKVPDEIVNRETRASIKDHWANKEGENDKMSFADGGDNIPSPTLHHNLRTPRVDFVTQHQFTDNRLAPSELRNYDEREPRTHQHLLNYIDMAEERPHSRDIPVGREPSAYYYYHPNPQSARRFRSYAPPPSPSIIDRERDYYRDDLYGEYDTPPNYSRDYYYQQMLPQRYENYYDRTRINDYNNNNNNELAASIVQQKPRKRIIYLANLPDIPKSPLPSAAAAAANAEIRYRDRYYNNDGYDRFSSNNNNNNEPYYRYNNNNNNMRKSYYPNNNLRYEDVAGIRNKAPLYPVKVLTDVNVREVKKNPESRIYSEVGGDRNNRYAYNTPSYRRADG